MCILDSMWMVVLNVVCQEMVGGIGIVSAAAHTKYILGEHLGSLSCAVRLMLMLLLLLL